MKFAWQNEDSGHHKVLFHIQWIDKGSHYFLNAGAYDHEQEVLLADGVDLYVKSVSDVECNGKGCLQNLEGALEPLNGTNIKIHSPAQNGTRLIEITDEKS